MTTKNFRKALNQLGAKPVKEKKYLKHCSPKDRSCGLAKRKCSRCGRVGGHIRKYGLDFCRQCFREVAKTIGFKKFK